MNLYILNAWINMIILLEIVSVILVITAARLITVSHLGYNDVFVMCIFIF